MANVLGADKRAAIIGTLAENSSVCSIERQTGVHRDTIMRVSVGRGCANRVSSPLMAVRASIVQEFRQRESEAEA
jgi:hypothetical protein